MVCNHSWNMPGGDSGRIYAIWRTPATETTSKRFQRRHGPFPCVTLGATKSDIKPTTMKKRIVQMTRRPQFDWDGKTGRMYAFELKFDDGTTGMANAKSESPWYKLNDEVAVSIHGERNGFPGVRIQNPEWSQGPKPNAAGTSHQRPNSSVMARWAIDAAMANAAMAGSGKIHPDAIRESAKQFMDMAEQLAIHHKNTFQ